MFLVTINLFSHLGMKMFQFSDYQSNLETVVCLVLIRRNQTPLMQKVNELIRRMTPGKKKESDSPKVSSSPTGTNTQPSEWDSLYIFTCTHLFFYCFFSTWFSLHSVLTFHNWKLYLLMKTNVSHWTLHGPSCIHQRVHSHYIHSERFRNWRMSCLLSEGWKHLQRSTRSSR